MTVSAHPLHWPPGFPRAKVREKGAFKTTLSGALGNVNDSLRRFATDSGKKIEALVMSSNVTLGVQRPTDPGVAVWFTWDGMSVCIAVDRYQTVEANLQAIHHIIEARRVELRHGTLALVRATFSGFRALPAPDAAEDWRTVLGVPNCRSLAEADEAYKRLRSIHHPDKGGQASEFYKINRAIDAAELELG